MMNPLPAPSPQDRAYLDELRRGFERDYHPQTTAEQVYLEELIASAQRLWHLNRIEDAQLSGEPDLDTLGKISRQRLAAERTFHRSRKLLEPAKVPQISGMQNEATPPQTLAPTPAPVPETSTNEPNRAVVPNEPKREPADERSLEQHIMSHGRAAAFREDEEETGYSDDLLELYFDLKANLPGGGLQHHVSTLTENLS